MTPFISSQARRYGHDTWADDADDACFCTNARRRFQHARRHALRLRLGRAGAASKRSRFYRLCFQTYFVAIERCAFKAPSYYRDDHDVPLIGSSPASTAFSARRWARCRYSCYSPTIIIAASGCCHDFLDKQEAIIASTSLFRPPRNAEISIHSPPLPCRRRPA